MGQAGVNSSAPLGKSRKAAGNLTIRTKMVVEAWPFPISVLKICLLFHLGVVPVICSQSAGTSKVKSGEVSRKCS